MKNDLKLFVRAFIFAVLSVIALQVPILGGLWGLLTMMPLTTILPEFGSSGAQVEYGFL